MPRPAWTRIGSRRSSASANRRSTSGWSSVNLSARGCSLIPRAPRVEAALGLRHRVGVRVEAAERHEPAAGRLRLGEDPVVRLGVAVRLVHREHDGARVHDRERVEQLLGAHAVAVGVVRARVRVGVEEVDVGQRLDPRHEQVVGIHSAAGYVRPAEQPRLRRVRAGRHRGCEARPAGLRPARVRARSAGSSSSTRADAPLAGWKQALPRFPEYIFNLARGALPGRPLRADLPRGVRDLRLRRGGGRQLRRPGRTTTASYYKGVGSATALSFLPYIGWMFSKDRSHVLEEPFGLNRIWVPCDGRGGARSGADRGRAALRVHTDGPRGPRRGQGPEPATACLTRASSRTPSCRTTCSRCSWRIRTGSSTRAGSAATSRSGTQNGTLVLRRNGFLRDPAMLDKLAMDTCAIAQQFADASPARGPSRRPFEDELPPRTLDDVIDLTAPPDPFAIPAGEWTKGFNEYARAPRPRPRGARARSIARSRSCPRRATRSR